LQQVALWLSISDTQQRCSGSTRLATAAAAALAAAAAAAVARTGGIANAVRRGIADTAAELQIYFSSSFCLRRIIA
jgi:hypothetical protein